MTRRAGSLLYPPGTYQVPHFYWRGGNEFKEAEHLEQNYYNVKKEHSKVKKQLEKVQNEYNEVRESLNYKEDQAVAIASALGGQSSTTEENSRLKSEISQVNHEINEIEEKISEAFQKTQQSHISQLEKERSQLYVAVERLVHDLEATRNEIDDLNMHYYDLLTSEAWREFNLVAAHHQITMREKNKIRSEVNRLFEEQNFAKENAKQDSPIRIRPSSNPTLASLSELIDQKDSLQNQLYNAAHNRFMAQTTRKVLIASKIDMLAQLNTILHDLGIEEVDIEYLKVKYLPEGPPSPIKIQNERPSTQLAKRSSKAQHSSRRPLSQSGRR